MTLRECYSAMGADYNEAILRFRSEDKVIKFLRKVPEDGSFALLDQSLKKGKAEDAFRAVHTLKGIALSMALTALASSAMALTEVLRGATEISEQAYPLFDQLKRDYIRTTACIRAL